VALTANVGTRK